MPHTKGAKKRLRQSEQRRARNRSVKSAVKTQIKKLIALPKDAAADKAQAEFRLAIKKLDQAAAKGVVHRNLAARKKSQLARLMNQRSSQSASTPTA